MSFEWSPEEFHERLTVCALDNIDEVEKYYAKNFETISGQYGVLLFMYTVFLTKVNIHSESSASIDGVLTKNIFLFFFFLFRICQTIENIISELLDTSEPLIHNTYGYASQGLINLMLTGQAVAHVWDHDKDVGGLSKLRQALGNVIDVAILKENFFPGWQSLMAPQSRSGLSLFTKNHNRWRYVPLRDAICFH